MFSRGLKKKPANSLPRPANPKKKSGSKSKSKQKQKKFNAKDFLDALIDLQNTNCSTNKKRRNTTRDISSALTIATPALQKTISASKIRSKSSFSQYRKKCNASPSEPLTINLCAIITEEDNVQYTEKTARSSYQEEQNQKNRINVDSNPAARRINENTCAIKIQRAWRNYQTFKMVHQAYLNERRNRQYKASKDRTQSLHIKICRPDLEKTLRIRKEHATKKYERKQQQFSQTRKIIQERCRQEGEESRAHSPIEGFRSQESQAESNNEQQLIQKMKERQARMLGEVIELIENESKSQPKQQLINKLIEKCQANKKMLEKDMQQEMVSQGEQSNVSEFKKLLNLKVPEQLQSEGSKSMEELISFERSQHSDGNLSQNYEDLADQLEEAKIFEQRLNYIKQQKMRRLEGIDDDILQSRITNSAAIRKKQGVYSRYEKQKKQINRTKKQYLFALGKLKKCAIQCHKSALKESASSSKIRKSFSAGNTVMKQVISGIKLAEIEDRYQELDMYKCIYKRQPAQQVAKPLTTTPILELPSPVKASQSDELLLEKNNNTEVLKEYSEQVQELIEKQLIEEFVTTVFLEEGLFEYFKPYVEEIYQFLKVGDNEICSFLQQLKQYLPDTKVMLRRVNQKINPTSLQILRIIRDLDYETDEYQLIIPEECFKKYRNQIEKNYEHLNGLGDFQSQQAASKICNPQVAEKVRRLEVEKREKMKKYRNFERDLKIMYMKSVFNCVNEFLIETKSSNAFMNGRSSIGPGELSLALKEYNQDYSEMDYQKLLCQVQSRLVGLVNTKCSIPSFKNYHDIEQFQKQVMKQIQMDSNENEFKWVNYMDEVLEIWQDLSTSIVDSLLVQAYHDFSYIFQ